MPSAQDQVAYNTARISPHPATVASGAVTVRPGLPVQVRPPYTDNAGGPTDATPPNTTVTGQTSDQGNTGADAEALKSLLSLYQSTYGNGGQGTGAAQPGTLVETPATGGTTDTSGSAPTAGASLNLTTVVLAVIVLGAGYLVYRHFRGKGKTLASIVTPSKGKE